PIPEYPYSVPSLLGFAFGLSVIIKSGRQALISLNARVQSNVETVWRWTAIFGIIASVPGMLLTISNLPSCLVIRCMFCRESGPIQTLRMVHNSQAQYQAAKQRFGLMKDLNEAGYIDLDVAGGRPIDGYVYSTSDITAETYCAHADRAHDQCGRRD